MAGSGLAMRLPERLFEATGELRRPERHGPLPAGAASGRTGAVPAVVSLPGSRKTQDRKSQEPVMPTIAEAATTIATTVAEATTTTTTPAATAAVAATFLVARCLTITP